MKELSLYTLQRPIVLSTHHETQLIMPDRMELFSDSKVEYHECRKLDIATFDVLVSLYMNHF